MWVEAVAATGSCGRILRFVFYRAPPHQRSGDMSVEATLIVLLLHRSCTKLDISQHYHSLPGATFEPLPQWLTVPTRSGWTLRGDTLEYIIAVHCMFVWHCIVHIATYIFWYPLLFTISPVVSSWKSHQRSKWWWSQGKGSGWGRLRIIDMFVTYIYIQYIYIHVHTYMYIQYTHIYSGFRRINQNKISNGIYKDMLLLQGHVAFETQIFITDEHIQTTYIKIHIWSCAHNCLFTTYMQSTPASTESFVCRVIGSLKFVPLRCLTNRATGKSASNQATMVQHVNTAQNGHDLQQLPKHSVCVTVRQA